MLTHAVLKAAVGGHAKAVRASLRRMGKKVSLRWLYYQCEPAPDVTRVDVYGAFCRLFEAILDANPPGADLLFEDFLARYNALRPEAEPDGRDLRAQIERCEAQHSDIVRAVIRGEDIRRLIVVTMEDIREKRLLLVMLKRSEARGGHQAFDVRGADGQEGVASRGAPTGRGRLERRDPAPVGGAGSSGIAA